MLQELEEQLGIETVYNDLCRAIPEEELKDYLEFIAKMRDVEL